MKLIDLEPELIRRTGEGSFCEVSTLADADGLLFLCPACYKAKGTPEGVHCIVCWSPKVPREVSPGPGRWVLSGVTLRDITLHPSIHVQGGCGAHFFVRDGEIVFA